MQENCLILFYPKGHEAHSEPGHPERPERVEAIRIALQEAGWWEGASFVEPLSLPNTVLQAVHTPDYLERLALACRRGAPLSLDTYTTPASWQIALNAAGGAAAVASAVWQAAAKQGGLAGEVSPGIRGFALTRPPGHHATSNQGMGFCLLNNIALAAEYLLQMEGAQRLAIVDLDLHHGNGTQEIFWRRGNVFYISTHQSPLFPGTGSLEETGAGPGAGTTVNLPLPPASGDQAFFAITETLILPLLDRFSPEMLLVSLGFDAHWRDPLGSLELSANGYYRILQRLAGWVDRNCQGRIALILEGGYDLEAGSTCALASLAALMNLHWEDPLGSSPYREGTSWQVTLNKARKIWGL